MSLTSNYLQDPILDPNINNPSYSKTPNIHKNNDKNNDNDEDKNNNKLDELIKDANIFIKNNKWETRPDFNDFSLTNFSNLDKLIEEIKPQLIDCEISKCVNGFRIISYLMKNNEKYIHRSHHYKYINNNIWSYMKIHTNLMYEKSPMICDEKFIWTIKDVIDNANLQL
jgi:hypothetical protein